MTGSAIKELLLAMCINMLKTLTGILQAAVPGARVDDPRGTPDHSNQRIKRSQHTRVKRIPVHSIRLNYQPVFLFSYIDYR